MCAHTPAACCFLHCHLAVPAVLQRKPYAEKVDIFSLGVMLYELFSRSLVIYTHTPANCAEDCERYAGKVAQGYR